MFDIRSYKADDWAEVWSILEPIFRAGETYAFSPNISESEALDIWTVPIGKAYVVIDKNAGRIVGTYYIKPNPEVPEGHVCNCGYVVSPSARGKGVASLMCAHSQDEARARGFSGMQFNQVASTNEGAVRLWQKLGFEIAQTLPRTFKHAKLGLVDAYVMYKKM
jgi:ribosomal protein S18 acetylase RimI-like enzyme